MTFMPWSDELSVGLDSIDEQHRWLVDATNRLYYAMTYEAPDRRVIGEIMEGLMDYTINHFIVEEELFQRYNYPAGTAHKALHDEFSATVMNAMSSFEAGADIGDDVLELLKDWLAKHIMGADKAYARYLSHHGVS